MKRNFLPTFVGIAMTKSQFCFCTGCTPYKLRQILLANPEKWKRMGYSKWDKLLMPNIVRELVLITGLPIDIDYYSQYVAGQRGKPAEVVTEEP